ncbi:MAG TPA: endonuclease/exonuclease/phosphatase family protein [Chthoniobacteraceae bacterium]|nr:endonuclease/exonuclease/phosphatase family protein [Chthoniobacteraceae bacterium]
MWLLRVFWLSLVLVLPALAAEPITVVSWNLEWFPGGFPDAPAAAQRRQMERAKNALAALQPDILCLQEVRDWRSAAELVSVVPGMKVQVISNFDGAQQQVIASRFPIDSGWSQRWKWKGKRSDHPPRGYTFAALKLPGDRFLLTYSLHLKANGRNTLRTDIRKREEATRQLALHVSGMERLFGRRGQSAVLVAGDFNTTPDDDEPRFLHEKTLRSLFDSGYRWTFSGVPPRERETVRATRRYPAITFDHVLTRRLGQPKARVERINGVSDHFPVVLEIR